MRHDVDDVIGSAVPLIERVRERTDQIREGDGHLQVSKTDVQMAMGQLRIALDYLAVRVDRVIYGGANHTRLTAQHKGLYFPHLNGSTGARKALASMYGDLDVKSPKIFNLFLSVQPDVAGTDWLPVLCQHTNSNKHADLTPNQIVGGMDAVVIGGPKGIVASGNTTLVFHGTSFGETIVGAKSPVVVRAKDSPASIEAALPGISVKRTKHGQAVTLAGTKWEVVALLDAAHAGVKRLAEAMFTELGI